MKRVLSFLTLAGAVAGAVWYARQQGQPEPAGAPGEGTGRPNLQAVPDRAPAPPPPSTDADDLTEIKGIGPKYAEQLSALGITSFTALAAADPVELAEHFEPRAGVEDWIEQAGERTGA